jgi:hypothetical protein
MYVAILHFPSVTQPHDRMAAFPDEGKRVEALVTDVNDGGREYDLNFSPAAYVSFRCIMSSSLSDCQPLLLHPASKNWLLSLKGFFLASHGPSLSSATDIDASAMFRYK